MRLLADENVPERILARLEAAGHDVDRISGVRRGAGDPSVLAMAADARRILLTLDRDFGELVVRERRRSAGVVLLRFRRRETVTMAEAVLRLLDEEGPRLHDALTIMRVGSRRRLPLPVE